jgi:two-component system cell cycle response regulator
MPGRILVVDDIISNVLLLEGRLIGAGFEVTSASSGPECLAKLNQQLPDVVLLDVMMPDMDGTEVCRRIKGNPKTAQVLVVLVTALSETAAQQAGIEAGADSFLLKPVTDEALFGCLKKVLGRS